MCVCIWLPWQPHIVYVCLYVSACGHLNVLNCYVPTILVVVVVVIVGRTRYRHGVRKATGRHINIPKYFGKQPTPYPWCASVSLSLYIYWAVRMHPKPEFILSRAKQVKCVYDHNTACRKVNRGTQTHFQKISGSPDRTVLVHVFISTPPPRNSTGTE